MATNSKPSAAALRAAAAQAEEQESGKRTNTALWRVFAFLLWALAGIAMYCPQIGELELPFGACRMLFLDCVTECIVDIVVAGVLCLIAAYLWKKANHIHPTESHNKIVQIVWNQLGVVMAGIIFAPLAYIIIKKSDKLDEKTRNTVLGVLTAVFLGTAAGSADYHPVTQDEVNEVLSEAQGEGFNTGDVCWTKYGKSYHFSNECKTLARSKAENISHGSLEEALNANRHDACDFCAKSDAAKQNALKEAKGAVKEAASEAKEAVKNAADEVKDELSEASKELKAEMEEAAQALQNEVED